MKCTTSRGNLLDVVRDEQMDAIAPFQLTSQERRAHDRHTACRGVLDFQRDSGGEPSWRQEDAGAIVNNGLRSSTMPTRSIDGSCARWGPSSIHLVRQWSAVHPGPFVVAQLAISRGTTTGLNPRWASGRLSSRRRTEIPVARETGARPDSGRGCCRASTRAGSRAREIHHALTRKPSESGRSRARGPLRRRSIASPSHQKLTRR